jgi:hypothetical protein
LLESAAFQWPTTLGFNDEEQPDSDAGNGFMAQEQDGPGPGQRRIWPCCGDRLAWHQEHSIGGLTSYFDPRLGHDEDGGNTKPQELCVVKPVTT